MPTTKRYPTEVEKSLLARQKADQPVGMAPHLVAVNPEVTASDAPYASEGQDLSGYIGVSQEYQGYADDTQKPLKTTTGAEAVVFEDHLAQFADTTPPAADAESVPSTPDGPPAPPAA